MKKLTVEILCKYLLDNGIEKFTLPELQSHFLTDYSTTQKVVEQLVSKKKAVFEGGLIYRFTEAKKVDAPTPKNEKEEKPETLEELEEKYLLDHDGEQEDVVDMFHKFYEDMKKKGKVDDVDDEDDDGDEEEDEDDDCLDVEDDDDDDDDDDIPFFLKRMRDRRKRLARFGKVSYDDDDDDEEDDEVDDLLNIIDEDYDDDDDDDDDDEEDDEDDDDVDLDAFGVDLKEVLDLFDVDSVINDDDDSAIKEDNDDAEKIDLENSKKLSEKYGELFLQTKRALANAGLVCGSPNPAEVGINLPFSLGRTRVWPNLVLRPEGVFISDNGIMLGKIVKKLDKVKSNAKYEKILSCNTVEEKNGQLQISVTSADTVLNKYVMFVCALNQIFALI